MGEGGKDAQILGEGDGIRRRSWKSESRYEWEWICLRSVRVRAYVCAGDCLDWSTCGIPTLLDRKTQYTCRSQMRLRVRNGFGFETTTTSAIRSHVYAFEIFPFSISSSVWHATGMACVRRCLLCYFADRMDRPAAPAALATMTTNIFVVGLKVRQRMASISVRWIVYSSCESTFVFMRFAGHSLSLSPFFSLDWVTNGRKDVNIDSLIYQPEGLTSNQSWRYGTNVDVTYALSATIYINFHSSVHPMDSMIESDWFDIIDI